MAILKQKCSLCGERHRLDEPHIYTESRATKVVVGDQSDSGSGWLVKIDGCQCGKCGHTWVPISGRKPKRCPGCMSRAWHVGS